MINTDLKHKNNLIKSSLSSLTLFCFVWLYVMLVNQPIISFDMLYQEQPILYLANQKITSLHDLIQVYLHPSMLEVSHIPFFRPSGHFLVYQVITQFLDWHNTRGFLIVNFFFLALACYMIIRLYALLFPRYIMGGYIASVIYLLHPALTLSRVTPMHFEFACVFFVLSGLYCFVLFCQKNGMGNDDTHKTQFKHYPLFYCSIGLYFISVTFKEVALMSGPVMAMYFCIARYRGRSLSTCISMLARHSESRQIIILLMVVTLMLVNYILMPRSALMHPLQNYDVMGTAPVVLFHLLKMLLGYGSSDTFPPLAQWILRALGVPLIAGLYLVYVAKQNESDALLLTYKKSCIFLSLAVLAFLIMPVIWGAGRPWHLSLSLAFLSLATGFFIDSLCHFFLRHRIGNTITGLAILISFGFAIFSVATSAVRVYSAESYGFPLQVARNAVLHPPAIKSRLNANSVLIVEDSELQSDYLLGDSYYPLEPFTDSLDRFRLMPFKGFYDIPFIYGGTLFRWAYLMPALNEQVYPFQIDKMRTIPGVTLYNWLQHYNTIFCLGYDSRGEWHDRTLPFKKNLLLEKARRHLSISQYKSTPVSMINMNANAEIRLPFADVLYCQFRCDENKTCKGFVYAEYENSGRKVPRCYFHDALVSGEMKPCKACIKFMKAQEKA